MQVKIVQWNVWYREQPEKIVETLRALQADIVCLQELTVAFPEHNFADVPSFIAQALGYEYHFCPAHQWPAPNVHQQPAQIGNGIFSRWPIAQRSAAVVHSPQPHQYVDPFSQQLRVYVEVEIPLIKHVAAPLTIGTTHLSYTDNFQFMPHQQRETNRLLELIAQHRQRYVLTGDFNALPSSDVISKIQQLLHHCGPTFEQNTWTTKPVTDANFQADGLNWRLDYIFATLDIEVQEAFTYPTTASDHVPIVVVIYA